MSSPVQGIFAVTLPPLGANHLLVIKKQFTKLRKSLFLHEEQLLSAWEGTVQATYSSMKSFVVHRAQPDHPANRLTESDFFRGRARDCVGVLVHDSQVPDQQVLCCIEPETLGCILHKERRPALQYSFSLDDDVPATPWSAHPLYKVCKPQLVFYDYNNKDGPNNFSRSQFIFESLKHQYDPMCMEPRERSEDAQAVDLTVRISQARARDWTLFPSPPTSGEKKQGGGVVEIQPHLSGQTVIKITRLPDGSNTKVFTRWDGEDLEMIMIAGDHPVVHQRPVSHLKTLQPERCSYEEGLPQPNCIRGGAEMQDPNTTPVFRNLFCNQVISGGSSVFSVPRREDIM